MSVGEIVAKAGASRMVAVLAIVAVLVARITAIQNPGDWIMYAASWITILHLCVGAFLFRHLGANSPVHHTLECAGLLCVVVLAGWFTHPVWWCIALSALMTIAAVKYTLLYRTDIRSVVRSYAIEKLWLEVPAIPIMALLAISFHRTAASGESSFKLSMVALTCTTLFAIWMVAVRRIYHRLWIGLNSSQPQITI